MDKKTRNLLIEIANTANSEMDNHKISLALSEIIGSLLLENYPKTEGNGFPENLKYEIAADIFEYNDKFLKPYVEKPAIEFIERIRNGTAEYINEFSEGNFSED